MILFCKKGLSVVVGRYLYTILGFGVKWDYYSIILTVNIATFELIIEFVHYKLHKKRWGVNGFGLHLDVEWPNFKKTDKKENK